MCVRNALKTKLFSIYRLIQYVRLPLFCSIGVAVFLHVTSATVVAVDDISGLVHFLLTAVFPLQIHHACLENQCSAFALYLYRFC